MPRGDGTGPRGQGPRTDRGSRSRGRGSSGQGSGDGFVAGPSGYCVCPNCGESVIHQLGRYCYEQKCPRCGAAMKMNKAGFPIESITRRNTTLAKA